MDGDHRVAIVTNRDVAPGEELFYNYHYEKRVGLDWLGWVGWLSWFGSGRLLRDELVLVALARGGGRRGGRDKEGGAAAGGAA